jgi:starch-binding outer membrane protein SusE/F
MLMSKVIHMKRYVNQILLITGCGLWLLSSCTKDAKVYYTGGGTAPVLSATASDSIPLPVTDTLATAVTFSWTNPNYTFSTGISSQNVTYYLEFDTLGAGFTSPNLQQVSFSSALGVTYTVSGLNKIMGNGLLLDTLNSHNVQVRVVSFIQPYSSGSAPAAPLYSDTLNFKVKPYVPPPAVAPPASGELYITGSATNDSWMVGGSPASVAGQQFTEVSPTLYTITLPLIGGGQFLVVPVAGDWTNKYATTDASSPTTGDTFSYNAANNFNGPTSSGTYTVTFNFQTGLYTITQ